MISELQWLSVTGPSWKWHSTLLEDCWVSMCKRYIMSYECQITLQNIYRTLLSTTRWTGVSKHSNGWAQDASEWALLNELWIFENTTAHATLETTFEWPQGFNGTNTFGWVHAFVNKKLWVVLKHQKILLEQPGTSPSNRKQMIWVSLKEHLWVAYGFIMEYYCMSSKCQQTLFSKLGVSPRKH